MSKEEEGKALIELIRRLTGSGYTLSIDPRKRFCIFKLESVGDVFSRKTEKATEEDGLIPTIEKLTAWLDGGQNATKTPQ